MQVIIIHAQNPMRNAGVALQSHSSAPIAQHFQPYGWVIIRTFENILTVSHRPENQELAYSFLSFQSKACLNLPETNLQVSRIEHRDLVALPQWLTPAQMTTVGISSSHTRRRKFGRRSRLKNGSARNSVGLVLASTRRIGASTRRFEYKIESWGQGHMGR
jgi:hypothetical protein